MKHVILDEFKEWHKSQLHEYTSGCSCYRCTAITDYLFEEWRDGRLTEENIADWIDRNAYTYGVADDYIYYGNNTTSKTINIYTDDPNFAEIFVYARLIGYNGG